MEKTQAVITNGTKRRIPIDEPVFLLRAQDQFAPAAVRHWAELVEAGGGDTAIVSSAREHAARMEAWPIKKVPDQPKPESAFVQVPETTLPSGLVVPAFEVSRYLCTVVNGKATVSAFDTPTVEINYHDANAACESAGMKLIRETQALALAWNVYNVAENWTGGAVGEGSLFQGLHKDTVDGVQPNDYESEDPEERRCFVLSNGERVYDVAGHLFTWVFDDVQGDEKGIIAKPITADSPSLSTVPHRSMEKGTGWRPSAPANWSGLALVRGGYWDSGAYAGVFRLGGDWPGGGVDYIGFRCTK
ncbi:MAG: hypothetical protein ACTHOL_19275 [Luteibacter jiangsuensis]